MVECYTKTSGGEQDGLHPLHPQSEGMVECYTKTVEEHLRKVVASNHRVRDAMLPLSILAYRTSTHDTTGLALQILVFGRELRLSGDLISGAPPHKGQATTDDAADWLDHVHEIHNYVCQHLQIASNRLNTRQDNLENCAGYKQGGIVTSYRPPRWRGISPKLQSSWEIPYKMFTPN
jgi:hypothetical protein